MESAKIIPSDNEASIAEIMQLPPNFIACHSTAGPQPRLFRD